MTEEAHHKLGPSTLKWVEICPGYRSDNGTNPMAEEGTMLHDRVENEHYEGLDEVQISLVDKCIEYSDIYCEKADEIFKEERLVINIYSDGQKMDGTNSLPPVPAHGMTSVFGTSDLTTIKKVERHIDQFDWKFGVNPVEDADINIQGQAYAVGSMDRFPWAKTITVHFVLPRRDEITTHTFTRADIEKARDRVRLIVDRALADDPKLNPNTESCKFCGRRVDCPALASELLPLARKYDSSSEDFKLALWQNADPALVTDPNTLSKMKRVASVVDNWKKAVDKRALDLAVEEGLEIPGFNLYYRNPTMKIDDAIKAFKAIENFVSAEDFQNACTVSLPNLAKAYAKSANTTVKNARAKIELKFVQAGILTADDDREKTPYLRAKR